MKSLNYSILFASALLATFMVPATQASLIGTNYVNSYVTATYNRKGRPWHEIASGSISDNNSITLVEGGTIDYGPSAGSYTVNAWAQTDYGYNRAEANLAATDLAFTQIWVDAYSTYQSIWTISPPSYAQAGEWGSATVGVRLSGMTDGYQGSTNLSASFNYVLECDDGACAKTKWDRYDDYHVIHTSTSRLPAGQQRGTLNGTYFGDLGFIYGQPFEVKSMLKTSVFINGFYDEGYSGWGSTDFSSTAALTYLQLPEGAFLTTGTGMSFPVSYSSPKQDPAAVPEPASVILLSTGILGLVLTRRRKTKKRMNDECRL